MLPSLAIDTEKKRRLQINGENYLLPTDVDTNITRTDLMEVAVNINKLMCQLSSSYVSTKDPSRTGILSLSLSPFLPP